MSLERDLTRMARTYNQLQRTAVPDRHTMAIAREAERRYQELRAMGVLDRGFARDLHAATRISRHIEETGMLRGASLRDAAIASSLSRELQSTSAMQLNALTAFQKSLLADRRMYEENATLMKLGARIQETLQVYRSTIDLVETVEPPPGPAGPGGSQDDREEHGSDFDATAVTQPQAALDHEFRVVAAAEAVIARARTRPIAIKVRDAAERLVDLLDLADFEGTGDPHIHRALESAAETFHIEMEGAVELLEFFGELDGYEEAGD